MQPLPLLAGMLAVLATAGTAAAQAALTGAGATFPNPIYSRWFDAYAKKTGVKKLDTAGCVFVEEIEDWIETQIGEGS